LLSQRRPNQVQPESGPERAFGKALREIRKAKKLSQEDLGLEANLDRTYVSLLERGLKSPTIRTVVKLAEVLNVMPSEIVQGMEGYLTRVVQKAARKLPRVSDPPVK